MPPSFLLRDASRGIFEADWLEDFVKKNYKDHYKDYKKGLIDLKDLAVVKFQKQFPREQRYVNGVLETTEAMELRYQGLPTVSDVDVFIGIMEVYRHY